MGVQIINHFIARYEAADNICSFVMLRHEASSSLCTAAMLVEEDPSCLRMTNIFNYALGRYEATTILESSLKLF